MIGLIVGAISGVLQYWLLLKFTQHVTSGRFQLTAVLFGLAQFFLPLLSLLGIAFLRRQDLLLTAIGMTGVIIVCAFTKFIAGLRREKRGDDRNV